MQLLTVPIELLHRILIFCHPCDIASFSRTCRSAYEVVQDGYLWRQIWHTYSFDNPHLVLAYRQGVGLYTPESEPLSSDYQWRSQFTQRMRAELLVTKRQQHFSSLSLRDKEAVLQLFISILEKALPADVGNGQLQDLSADIEWAQRVLSESMVIAPGALSLEDEREIHELQARIRSGMDEFNWDRKAQCKRRNRSRAIVYNLQNYSHGNDYAPCHANGKVNWIHIGCIADVISSNLQDLPVQTVSSARPPSGFGSLRPYSAPGGYSPKDWAGVEDWFAVYLQKPAYDNKATGEDTFALWITGKDPV